MTTHRKQPQQNNASMCDLSKESSSVSGEDGKAFEILGEGKGYQSWKGFLWSLKPLEGLEGMNETRLTL